MDQLNRPARGTRTGFTTGACAAAAARAATRCLIQGTILQTIETTLPNRSIVNFTLNRCELESQRATCSIIKDAGDDPDCTHGAEIVAEVHLSDRDGVELHGGKGVGVVTKPGLGLEIGGPAINPVPRKNITEMVQWELDHANDTAVRGAIVTISVPGGEKMALETLNGRLGILGGISILGTTGLVLPYSTAAYRRSVVQAIDVAVTRGNRELVVTTGGKSEKFAMELYPALPEEAFIQVGDFIGVGIKHAATREAKLVRIVGMMGKLSKMANGKMMTHTGGSDVNMELLAQIAAGIGAAPDLVRAIQEANTARHVLELCQAAGMTGLPAAVCTLAAEHCSRHANGKIQVAAQMVDFDGTPLGVYITNEVGAT